MRRSAASGIVFIAAFFAAVPALSEPKVYNSLHEMLGMKPPGLRGAELQAAIAKAEAFPLGSEQNPVRTTGVTGERYYLARLRCSNGKAPKVLGRGPGMPSPFGGVTDIYRVECKSGSPQTAFIAMDMYHQHVEARPVPGFVIK